MSDTPKIDLGELREYAHRENADAPEPDVAYAELHPDELLALIDVAEAARSLEASLLDGPDGLLVTDPAFVRQLRDALARFS